MRRGWRHFAAPAAGQPLPLTIADLVGWYNGDDVVVSGSAVTQLNDLSGNGNHATQGTAGNQGSTGPTLNGRAGVSFDADAHYLHAALAGGNTGTIVMVLNPGTMPNTGLNLHGTGATSDSVPGYMVRTTGGGSIGRPSFFVGDGVGRASTTPATVLTNNAGNVLIFAWAPSGANTVLDSWINGTTATATLTGRNAGAGTGRVGISSSGHPHSWFSFAFYSSKRTSTEIANLGAYYQTYYSLS